jgi:hypothetical protein
MRFTASQEPSNAPCFSSASRAKSEQLGAKRQFEPSIGRSRYWYREYPSAARLSCARHERGEETRSFDDRSIELRAVGDFLDAQYHVIAQQRRPHGANRFAQAAAQAIAIDGTGRVLLPMT